MVVLSSKNTRHIYNRSTDKNQPLGNSIATLFDPWKMSYPNPNQRETQLTVLSVKIADAPLIANMGGSDVILRMLVVLVSGTQKRTKQQFSQEK